MAMAKKRKRTAPKHTVRFLREDDLYERSSFFETLANLRKDDKITISKMRRAFRERKKHGVVTYVIVVGGIIVATTSVVFEPKFIHDGGKIAHIEDVATMKGHEGNGYATELLKRAIQLARRRG